MHAAANKKGGVGGVSQTVGKEFAAADKPGKLPNRAGDRNMTSKGKPKLNA
jgi:hypothetical protein